MSALGNKDVMARNIQFYLEMTGTSRAELAKAIDVPYTTLSAWLQAKTYPRIDKIEKMASYFGIRKSDLVENDAESSRQTAFKEDDAWRNDEMEELLELVAVLDDSDMEKIVDYLKLLIAAKGK